MISEKKEKMETVLEKHVQTSGNSTEPTFEEQNDSLGSSNDDSADEATDGVTNSSDGEEAEHKDEGEDEEGDDHNANAGWAEVMAKILGKKTPESQTSILLKNKELDKVKEEEQQEKLQRKKQVDKRRAWEMMCRKKPDLVKDRETERALQRIATRGVVQLFNAVRKHQNVVNDKVKEAGGSERKKAKLLSSVSKKDFIDVLRRTEGGGVSGKTEKDTVAAAEEKPAWSVLRDDFMMGASMKDWDKESDKEEPTNSGREAEESD